MTVTRTKLLRRYFLYLEVIGSSLVCSVKDSIPEILGQNVVPVVQNPDIIRVSS
jgi:hypothetical protein